MSLASWRSLGKGGSFEVGGGTRYATSWRRVPGDSWRARSKKTFRGWRGTQLIAGYDEVGWAQSPIAGSIPLPERYLNAGGFFAVCATSRW